MLWFSRRPAPSRVALAAATGLLLAACASGPDPVAKPAPGPEIKIARFTYSFGGGTHAPQTVYRVFLSKAWVARHGDRIADDFTTFSYPAVAPIDDDVLAALLARFDEAGFFALPSRGVVVRQDIIPDDAKRNETTFALGYNANALYRRSQTDPALRYSTDVLVVESDRGRSRVFLNDCVGAQLQMYGECFAAFEELARANPPVQTVVVVEPTPMGRRPTYVPTEPLIDVKPIFITNPKPEFSGPEDEPKKKDEPPSPPQGAEKEFGAVQAAAQLAATGKGNFKWSMVQNSLDRFLASYGSDAWTVAHKADVDGLQEEVRRHARH